MDFKDKEVIVRSVQRSLNLEDDGIDGPLTWQTILNKINTSTGQSGATKPNIAPANKDGAMSLVKKLIELARDEVGVREIGDTNCGKRVNEYKGATYLDSTQGWPWCAAFICWLFREAMKGSSYSFKRPTTASAWDFENWANDQDMSVRTKKPTGGDIVAGDIIIFTFSHIGIAVSAPDKNGMVQTIEGNTDDAGSREGGGVYLKQRHLSQIRSRLRVCV